MPSLRKKVYYAMYCALIIPLALYAENLNNGFFLCFLSYVAVMLSVADISQLLWVIIALYIIYNSELKA